MFRRALVSAGVDFTCLSRDRESADVPSMMFRPLPAWAFVLSFLFPLTIAFAELPTYFGYVMPRLASQLKKAVSPG